MPNAGNRDATREKAALELTPNEAPAWHCLSPSDALSRLAVDPELGLSEAEADRRRARFGENRRPERRRRSFWRILWDQVRSLVVLLLFAAAVAAALFDDRLEALAIAAVLVINVGIGFVMEWRAQGAMEALRELEPDEARMLRDGEERQEPARMLVPGDVVLLEAGDTVPADLRLLLSSELQIVEAALTGESMPVAKRVEACEEAEAPLAERPCMAWKGTSVATGHARGVVVATGSSSELGKIGDLAESVEESRTPLEHRLDVLGRRLVVLCLAAAALLTGLGFWRGQDPWQTLETAIALAVAAVPEGLPVVATITLAIGMHRMARRQALIRRLPAVETLGSVTTICADKTGTLTRGEQTVVRLRVAGRTYAVSGVGYGESGEISDEEGRTLAELPAPLRRALEIGVATNRALLEVVEGEVEPVGDPTEAALLVLGKKGGVERDEVVKRQPEVAEIPFSSERMYMATFHRDDSGESGGGLAFVKGAPTRLVENAQRRSTADGSEDLDEAGRRELSEENAALAEEGLRVLALAYAELDAAELERVTRQAPGGIEELDLIFVGHVAIVDRPVEGVEETVRRLRRAGVRPVMITGDQRRTAEAIARQLGILEADQEVLDARELVGLDDEEMAVRVARIGAYSRTSPGQKLQIVEALQRGGEIVGMLGDGVNDAPALKRADVGVAMGRRGTDVARESSDLVLLDDSLQSVEAAVEEGRVIFDNIRRFIFYLFSCNLSEVLVVLGPGLVGGQLPILPLQILWLNLVTDVFPALSLAVEPASSDVMDRPPRDPHESLVSRAFAGRIVGYGLLLTAIVLAAFYWSLGSGAGPAEEATRRAITIAFTTLGLCQVVHVLNARAEGSILVSARLLQNRWSWAAVVLCVGLQVAAVHLPALQRVLGTVALRPAEWLLVAGLSLVPLLGGELVRGAATLFRRRSRSARGAATARA